MKKMMSYEIRDMWLKFWKGKGHEIIPSASLIPVNDPTLLWINAGIAPLKPYFDGRKVPHNRRMANAQKSIRTNDIENVGKTARHHTFFEMLGNFSIGDYFRNEALTYAMEILTSPEYFAFDLNRLYFTVYPLDNDTINKWMELGVKEDHIIPLQDNFWEIGEGPCGPDTEIFFDRGEKYDPLHEGVKLLKEDRENERYIEIWNIVFSQYNAKSGVDRRNYKELPSKNIDTGMGLERVACVMQEVPTNYETDLFMPIINKCSEIVKKEYSGQMSFKVIADHIRTVVFALNDGATFSNEGRGYVLRRLLRRAIRYGKTLGMETSFLYRLVPVVVDNMKSFYPYLVDNLELVMKQVKIEEEKFLLTLSTGEKKLLDYLNNSKDKVVTKEMSFLLYDTFGFPLELTIEVANEYGFTVDVQGFQEMLVEQKQNSRKSRVNIDSMNVQNPEMMAFKRESIFVGYETLETDSQIIGLFKDSRMVESGKGVIIAVPNKSGFYAESGGQIGDIGNLTLNNHNYQVTNTIKLPNGQPGLVVNMRDDILRVGDKVFLSVDEDFRFDIAKNHSATHLLNESLRRVVGSHIFQQGSYVANNFLRFDFNNFSPLTNEEILKVEDEVNKEILAGHKVNIKKMNIDEAKKLGAQAVFGEKYGDTVRVVDMEYSKEFCGGTHVHNTKDIKRFAIIGIETKGSGIYRIEAATDTHIEEELATALENIEKEIKFNIDKIVELKKIAKEYHITIDNVSEEISPIVPSYQMVLNRRAELESLKQSVKNLDKQINKAIKEQNTIELDEYLQKQEIINHKNVLISCEENIDVEIAKDLVDRLSDKIGKSVIVFAILGNNKIVFICKNKYEDLDAGKIVRQLAVATGGAGGGRKDFAQAGGHDITKLNGAIEELRRALGGQ